MKMVFKKNNLPQSIYLDQVQISDGFWGKRQSVNRENTIPAIYKKLQETGRIDAWNMNPDRQLAEKRSVIHMFYDSDTGKWVEAAAYSLQKYPNPDLEQQVDTIHQKR